MRKIFTAILSICSLLSVYAQEAVKEKLINQGVWFLFSARVEEHFNDDKNLTQIDFFKKSDVSSILFDRDDKLYSVFSKDGSDVWEDLWRMVDETHFVMVSPQDSSSQLMNIMELNQKMLVLKNCSDIEGGSRCVTYTYFSSKEGWLPDNEIDDLNSAGVIDMDEVMSSIEKK